MPGGNGMNGWAMKILATLVAVAILTSLAVAGNDRSQDKELETIEYTLRVHAKDIRKDREAIIRSEEQFIRIDENLVRITKAIEKIAQ